MVCPISKAPPNTTEKCSYLETGKVIWCLFTRREFDSAVKPLLSCVNEYFRMVILVILDMTMLWALHVKELVETWVKCQICGKTIITKHNQHNQQHPTKKLQEMQTERNESNEAEFLKISGKCMCHLYFLTRGYVPKCIRAKYVRWPWNSDIQFRVFTTWNPFTAAVGRVPGDLNTFHCNSSQRAKFESLVPRKFA